jgi:hypothetical protein
MVRYSAGGVKVLWATPADGYTAKIEPENDGVRGEFRSSHHRSRLLVWWSGGPQYQVREDSGGDGEH